MAKILIVEDDEAIAGLEEDYLTAEGYETETAHDGEEGLKKALSTDYDLMLLDVMLPKMDGFELLERVRFEKDIPILLVTARKEDIDKIKGLGLGADDYVTKPFSPGELVARVKAHLSRYSRLIGIADLEKDVLKVRGLRLERKTKRVFVNGEEKRLTVREYELLYFFMTHPNKVYSKQDLFREVWGSEEYGDLATVPVHVNKLREKIEVDRDNPQYVETVWGMGYRLKI
ncbi:MAG: response regulator transcription factor [Lachnospiraceae bacterium]|nr:response regulator transcription factor [Lachnospiraceae bacterium]MBQ6258872.1 response regulator transcription factor [Lachnospiraceae bacterium]